MKKNFALLLLLTLQIGIFAQERIAKGFVLDKESHAALEGAEIMVEGQTSKATTNVKGEFVVNVEKGYPNLLIRKDNYKDFRFRLRPGFQHKPARVYLESLDYVKNVTKNQERKDSLFYLYKNAVSLSINELLQMGIGLRYERFIVPRHSLGLHATYYFFGFGSLPNIEESELELDYTGLKLCPFYRFYPLRKNGIGVFIEGKIPFGYFQFHDLEYYYEAENYDLFVSYSSPSFWTWGYGASIGFMSRLHRTKQGILNISLGYQYFPIRDLPGQLPLEMPDGTAVQMKDESTDWWRNRGPGAIIEIKLTIGGIY